MIDLARTRRPRPNITYRQADLRDVGDADRYDFVLSLLTLHHVPDLHAALSHVKTLLAPGGRAALMDIYQAESDLRPQQALRRMVHRVVPLRPRLHALAVQKLSVNLVRRGPATAWEIYRLSTRREWLDHRVTDRFFSRDELGRSCQSLFPGYRFDILGGPRGIGLVWDAPSNTAARKSDADPEMPSADVRGSASVAQSSGHRCIAGQIPSCSAASAAPSSCVSPGRPLLWPPLRACLSSHLLSARCLWFCPVSLVRAAAGTPQARSWSRRLQRAAAVVSCSGCWQSCPYLSGPVAATIRA